MGVLFKYGRRFYFAPSFNNKTIGTKMLEVCNQKKKCNNLNLFALIKIVVVICKSDYLCKKLSAI